MQEINHLKRRIVELEALIPPPKPRFTLRSVIWAIRYLVRLARLLARKDFTGLGKLGYNELLRRQEKFIKLLNNSNEKLQRRVRIADESFLFQQAELESYRAVLQEKKVELVDHQELKQVLRRTESLLRASEREKEEVLALSAETVEAQNVVINQRVHVALAGQHDHHLQQAKVYAQIQRNLGHHLAQSIFRVRSVISALDIDSEMPLLTKKYEPTPVSTHGSHNASFSANSDVSSKPATAFLPKPKAKQLALAVKTKSRQLISWIKKNRIRASLMPKKVPVILFKEPKSSAEHDVFAARKQRARELSVMTHVIQHDFEHVEEVRKVTDADIRKVQDYVLAMKNKHNELLQVIKNLEEELREERLPSQSSRAPRKRIGDIKSSYSHLINSTDADHQNSYFSNVLSAIETVQAEHGDIYKDKLVKSGKFKLSDVAKTVVRRTSVTTSTKGGASMKGGGSFIRGSISSPSDKIGFEDATPTPSRSSSIAANTGGGGGGGGYPLNKLHSLLELDHEHDHHDHDHQNPAQEPQETNDRRRKTPALPTIASASAATTSSSLHESSIEKMNVLVPELNPLNPPSIILEDFVDDDRRSSKKTSRQASHNGNFEVENTINPSNMWGEAGLHDTSVLSAGSASVHELLLGPQSPPVGSPASQHVAHEQASPSAPIAGKQWTSSTGGASHISGPVGVATQQAARSEVPNKHAGGGNVAPNSSGNAPHSIVANKPSTGHGDGGIDASAVRVDAPTEANRRDAPVGATNVSASVPLVQRIELDSLQRSQAAAPSAARIPSSTVPSSAVGTDTINKPGSDSARSFGNGGETSVVPSEAGRPPPPQREESTFGFETIGFEVDDEGVQSGDGQVEEEVDEDVLYMEDLLAAKDEMVELLSREEVIQNKIKAAEEYKQMLEGQVKNLEWRLERKEIEYQELEEQVFTIGGEQKQLQTEFESLTHQNDLLREIVEEDYRHHATNLEKALQERDEKERLKTKKKYITANQSTQVSCAVCAIREEGLQHIPLRPVHGYDDATVAMVNESFTRALNGEVVLIAQPRRINKEKKVRAVPPPEPARAAQVAAFEEIREGIRTMELARASKNPGSTLDGVDGSAARLDRNAAGFSEALIKHLESNQYQSMVNAAGNSKPSSANKNAPANPAAAEGSKFSRMKKMPTKATGSASSGDLLNGTNSSTKVGLPPTRPHSAVATQKKNIEQRTESNTAAYLQNQLMFGYGSSPQIAPMYTDAVVPLHTLDLANGRPDSTAAYLAHVLSKQRASSASAARTEHTTSAYLLNTVEERSGNGSEASARRGKQEKPPKKLQLDLHVPNLLQGASAANARLQHYSADITDEMSDGVADEFI